MQETSRWGAMLDLVTTVALTDKTDRVSCHLNASGRFSVKSLYHKLCQGTVHREVKGLWQARVPLKIKVFLWQLFRDRLPTSNNIAKQNDPASGMCALCGNPDNANHAFFLCPLARFAWSPVRDAAGVTWDPRSSSELVDLLHSVQGQPKWVIWTSIGAMLCPYGLLATSLPLKARSCHTWLT